MKMEIDGESKKRIAELYQSMQRAIFNAELEIANGNDKSGLLETLIFELNDSAVQYAVAVDRAFTV